MRFLTFRRILVAGIAGFAAVGLFSTSLSASGVTLGESSTAPMVTATPVPTSTPLLTPTPTPTPTPTSTPTATPVTTSSPTSTIASVFSVPTDPTNRTNRIIVKYRPGVIGMMDAGMPLGSESAVTVPVIGGTEITDGLVTLTLASTVDLNVAQQVANELELNPDIEWAQPDGWRQIVADVTPMAVTSPVDVAVLGSTGSAKKTNGFTYTDAPPAPTTPAPTATTLSKTVGPTAGGTTVTLTGTNLSSTTSIAIGGTGATLGAITDTTVEFTTPAKSAGSYNVVVTTSGGTATASTQFTFVAPPTATTMVPASGPVAGGTSVTLSGTNLALTSSITIGGVEATLGTKTANSVTFIAPAKPAGSYTVVVTTPGGSATSSGIFTYVNTPTVTSLNKTAGPTAGGTVVVATGTNLTGVTSVTVGATPATAVTVLDATRVQFTMPAMGAGTYKVTATSPGGSGILPAAFTYHAPPTLSASAVNPAVGPVAGGQTVTITGANLSGATTVTIGSLSASITGRSSTTVTVVTPPKAATGSAVNIVVTTPGGSVTGTGVYTFVSLPTVTAVTPAKGLGGGGTPVTISGTNLQYATSITFGGTAGSITTKTATSLVATSPAHALGKVDIVIVGQNGSVTKASAYEYVPAPPGVASMSPTSGSVDGGTIVTLTGSNLGDVSSVKFGGVAGTIQSQTPTGLTVKSPAHGAGQVNVIATGPGGPSVAKQFTYVIPPPAITSLTPVLGTPSGGTVVTLTGTHFSGATAVKFGATPAGAVAGTSLNVMSDTQVRVTTPVGVGVKNVYLVTPYGTATKTNGFTYAPAPIISSASVSSGPLAGGTVVTITGTNLAGTSSVKFGTTLSGATAGGGLTVLSDTQVRITTPAMTTEGARSIYLTTQSGTATKAGGFTYVGVPTVTSFTPASGSTEGGQTVVITGTKFTNASAVRFGSLTATITAKTATTITVTTPADTVAELVSIYVVTPGGTSPASAAKFAYLAPAPVAPAARGSVGIASATMASAGLAPASTTSLPAIESRVSIASSALTSACPASTATVRIQRCFDDSDSDSAPASTYGELAYSDFYVSGAARGTLIADIVPKAAVPNDAWLATSTSDMYVLFDTNNDQQWDVGLRAPNVSGSVPAGATLNALVMDYVPASDSTTYRNVSAAAVCSATLTRKNTAHGATGSTSWWQFSADWACLFGSNANATSVDPVAYLSDTVIFGTAFGDYAPDQFAGNPMNLPAALVDTPVITSISPNSGALAGGTQVTITGTGLADMTKVTFGGVPGTITSKTATSIVVTTPASATIAATPTETKYTDGTLWGLGAANPSIGKYGINAAGAWSKTQGNPNIIVAVIDTGVTTHTDLGSVALGSQVPGYDMIDDSRYANDGDGRDNNPADPGDFVTAAEDATAGGPFEGCGADSSSWHGTHVEGTINALNNGVGSVGVAPKVRVEPIRVLGKCGGSTSDIVAGIIWASGGSVSGVPDNANPANVISMSLGGSGTCDPAEQYAINFALNRGIVVTVAAGNENKDAANASPASCDGVITVAATDSAGKRGASTIGGVKYPFSNYGSTVEIAAPGVDIYSTLNAGATVPGAQSYQSYNGTSMATPHVAGVVALMLSRDPTLTPDQVLARIQSTATAFGGGACDSVAAKSCGVGIINAGAAVQ